MQFFALAAVSVAVALTVTATPPDMNVTTLTVADGYVRIPTEAPCPEYTPTECIINTIWSLTDLNACLAQLDSECEIDAIIRYNASDVIVCDEDEIMFVNVKDAVDPLGLDIDHIYVTLTDSTGCEDIGLNVMPYGSLPDATKLCHWFMYGGPGINEGDVWYFGNEIDARLYRPAALSTFSVFGLHAGGCERWEKPVVFQLQASGKMTGHGGGNASSPPSGVNATSTTVTLDGDSCPESLPAECEEAA